MTSVPNINSAQPARAEPGRSRPVWDGQPAGLPDRSTMALSALIGDGVGGSVAEGGGPMEEQAGGEKTHFSLEGIDFDEPDDFGHCGRYQIDREHKRGAMGVIYRGFDTHLGREVALKFLLDEHRGRVELRDRFLQEARITARLQHGGIVPVYDLHRVAENGLFFSMMFVHGSTLKDLLKRRATPSSDLPRFLTVFEKICQTMAYAHVQEVIHRDLKPSNVMVGDFGVVRVMDWGLAKVLVERRIAGGAAESSGNGEPAATVALAPVPQPGGASLSRGTLGGAMGTLAYMAPEQARGQSAMVDKRADVFGLGAVLCEILTGNPPYDGRTIDELYRMAMRVELGPSMARLDRCLADPSLVLLAKNCLRENPEDRPHDAGEVAAVMTAQLESDLQRTALDMVRFFELSHDLFCLASLDGFFKRVNDNFTRVLGFTKSELQARPFLDFVHPDDLNETLAQMRKLSLGLPVVCFKNRYRDVSGGYHWFEWTAKSLPEEQLIFAVARADQTGLAPQSEQTVGLGDR